MYQYICKLVSFKVCADIKFKKILEFQRFFTNIIPANWDFRFCNSELSWLEASSLPDNWVVKSAKSRDIMLNLNLSPAPQSQEFNKQPYIHLDQIIYSQTLLSRKIWDWLKTSRYPTIGAIKGKILKV